MTRNKVSLWAGLLLMMVVPGLQAGDVCGVGYIDEIKLFNAAGGDQYQTVKIRVDDKGFRNPGFSPDSTNYWKFGGDFYYIVFEYDQMIDDASNREYFTGMGVYFTRLLQAMASKSVVRIYSHGATCKEDFGKLAIRICSDDNDCNEGGENGNSQ